MEPELGSVDFVGRNKHEGVPTDEWELRLLFAHQESRADPFGWQPVVSLLSQWKHTRMERLKMNETCELNILRHIQIQKYMK